jgi:DNA-binding CsgD family transcriptional regulator
MDDASALSRAGDPLREESPFPSQEEWPELTPRQRQILELLRAGKVNKEIANELGIGLGTVKQHVVALFKKLKVRNRAMAVSRGLELAPAGPRERVPVLAAESLLERRPCLVLSLVLPEAAPEEAGRLLQQTLATYAFDHDALFLARKGHAGDQIFGIQRASTHDMFLALRAAHEAFCALAAHDKGLANALQGGLTAGLAIASMNRNGGWSGEAIASTAIAQARELAREAKPGTLVLSPTAQDLLRAQSPCASAPAAPALHLAALDWLPWRGGAEEPAPIGREPEMALLEESLAKVAGGPGRVLCLEGETGMGKSHLCRHAATRAGDLGGRAHYFVCQPDVRGARLYSLPYGIPSTLDGACALIADPPLARPEIVIVDDCHLLVAADCARLAQQGARAEGKLVLLAGRRIPEIAVKGESLRLGRLTQSATEQIVVRSTDPAQAPDGPALARLAAGVPLFAVELARHRGEDPLPLPLRMVIAARMDSLGLDRPLLRQLALASAPLGMAELAKELRAGCGTVRRAIDQAVACGVLRADDRGCLSFSHPLLRQAVIHAQVI